MSITSPNLALPMLDAQQRQKHLTVNEALLRLDRLTQLSVISRSRRQVPADPQEGQAWILPADTEGDAWAGLSPGQIVVFQSAGWVSLMPRPGWSAWVEDEAALLRFADSRWTPAASGPLSRSPAEFCQCRSREHIVQGLSGEDIETDLLIPARALVLAVVSEVMDTLPGVTGYDCGLAGEPALFGGALGSHAGQRNVGVIGPRPVYADTPVRLLARGGVFAGGRVRLTAHYLVFDPST